MEKIYISAQQLLEYSFELAKKNHEAQFIPDILIGLWRGGTPTGIAIHEYFHYQGHEIFHTAVKAESYQGFAPGPAVIIKGLQDVIDIVESDHNMLLIDDIFDTGNTMKHLIEEIKHRARKNAPVIKIATLFYKESKNQTEITPDFYLRKVEEWIVFPHELIGLTKDEIKQKNLHMVL